MNTNYSKDFSLVFIISCILFIAFNWTYPLMAPDEARYAEIAREMFTTGNYLIPHLNGAVFLDKPILFYWLECLSFHVFGVSEFSARLIPALMGALGCAMTYYAGARLFNRRTGILSAFIISSSMIYFLASHYVNMDLTVAVFITSSLFLFIVAANSESKVSTTSTSNATSQKDNINLHTNANSNNESNNDLFIECNNLHTKKTKHYIRPLCLYLAYTCAGLAFLTKGMMGIVFPMMIIGTWIIVNNKWSIIKDMKLVTGLGLFTLITAPWYFIANYKLPGLLHYIFINQQIDRFVGSDFNNQQGLWFYFAILAIGIFPWIFFLAPTIHLSIKNIITKFKTNTVRYSTGKNLKNSDSHSNLSGQNKQHFTMKSETDINKEFLKNNSKNPAESASNNKSIISYLLIWPALIFIFFSIPSSKIISYLLPVFPPLALLVAHYLDINWNKLSQKGVKYSLLAYEGFAIATGIMLITLQAVPTNINSISSNHYLASIGTILIISSCLIHWSKRRRNLLPSITILGVSTIILSWIFIFSIPSTRPSNINLALTLNNLSNPSDKVVNYFDYMQDLPFYSHQPVLVVDNWDKPGITDHDNYHHDLGAITYLKPANTLITPKTFNYVWDNNKTFAFVKKNNLETFENKYKSNLIKCQNKICLLSNMQGEK